MTTSLRPATVRPDGGRSAARPDGERTASAATEFMRPERGRQPLACWDADPELFFPIAENDPVHEIAKALCRGCWALDQCAARAEEERIDHGTWGAMTEWERRAARRKRNRTANAVGSVA